jgi:hypothetical protein
VEKKKGRARNDPLILSLSKDSTSLKRSTRHGHRVTLTAAPEIAQGDVTGNVQLCLPEAEQALPRKRGPLAGDGGGVNCFASIGHWAAP